MNDFLDRVWEQIQVLLNFAVISLDTLFSPLEILGPGFVIFVLAGLVVGITRLNAKFYETKRFVTLKKDFEHWQSVREEAMKQPDREKGKALAKNIDQAQLNRAYYDYFFEGLLKNFITNVLPMLLTAAYVTTIYTPQNLLNRFGTQWVFSFSFGSSQVNVSSLLWFVVCVIFSFILFYILKIILKKPHVKNALA
ncbi:MAG: hypothetical protein L3J69_00165 [Desulfobacula sp.]|nr:hypothetical protein [Desulfobacula sp.]